jgi:hypothetical protein
MEQLLKNAEDALNEDENQGLLKKDEDRSDKK